MRVNESIKLKIRSFLIHTPHFTHNTDTTQLSYVLGCLSLTDCGGNDDQLKYAGAIGPMKNNSGMIVQRLDYLLGGGWGYDNSPITQIGVPWWNPRRKARALNTCAISLKRM